MARVFVVGPPRSGTTWIAQTLGRTTGSCYVHEPDGDHEVFALVAKRGGPRHVEPARGEPSAAYARLWAGAFAGGGRDRSLRGRVAERCFEEAPRERRTAARRGGPVDLRLRVALALARPLRPRPDARNVVVKSVHACLAVEWIAERFAPVVVAVERSPLNVLASWHELGQGVDAVEYAELRDVARRRWDVQLPEPDAPRIARQAAFYGVLQGALNETRAAHAGWIRVRHEDLLADPRAAYEELCGRAGLAYSEACDEYLAQSNQPGEGYQTRRVAADLAHAWRDRLDDVQVADALGVLRDFPARLGLLDAAEEAS